MLIPVILFLFVFETYLLTHCASFNINDSGETVMVCDLMTLSHSPGYPLHTLLGRVFCLLSMGQPMFRVTLFSMLTGAASAVLTYSLLRESFRIILGKAPAEPALSPSKGSQPSGPSAPPKQVVPAFSSDSLGASQEPALLNRWIYEGPALFGALCFAFSYQNWFQVCGAKGSIYALNSFLTLGILFLFFKMRQSGWFIKSFILVGFFYSLGLTHHWPNMGVMAPAFLWLLINSQKRIAVIEFFKMAFNPVYIFFLLLVFAVFFFVTDKSFTLGLAFASLAAASFVAVRIFGMLNFTRFLTFSLLGLSSYLYLPIRATQNPVVNWWNPRNLDRLWGTVVRKGYAGIGDMQSGMAVRFARNGTRFWMHAKHQFGDYFTFFIYVMAILGVIWLWQRQKSSAIGFFLLGFGVFSGIMLFNNPLEGYQWTLDNFFTPFFLVIAMFAAAGIASVCEFAALAASKNIPFLRSILGGACVGLGLLTLALNYTAKDVKTSSGQTIYECNDQSRYVSSYDYGVNMLKSVNRNAVILCNGDIDILPLWYLQFVMGKRPEVTSFTMQLIPYDWYRDPLFKRYPFLAVPLRLAQGGVQDIRPEIVVQDMINQHAKEKSFYFTNIFTATWMRPQNASIPEGFMWRMVNTQGLNYAFTSERLNQYWSTYRLRYLEAPERGYWDEYTDVMKDSYGIGHDFTGLFAYTNKMPDLALWSYSNALKYRQPQTLSRIYMMLGQAYYDLRVPLSAISSYQEVLNREGNNPGARAAVYAKIGDAFRMMSEFQDARMAYQNSLAINPQQSDAVSGLQAVTQEEWKAAGGHTKP